MKRIVITSFLVCVVGCGSSNESSTSSGATGGTTGGSGGAGGSTGGGGGAGGTSGSGGTSGGDAGGQIPTGTCTEAGSVCVTFKLPTITDSPTRLIVGFYLADLPPLGPPDKTGGIFDAPSIMPGTELTVKMTGLAMDGDYNMYAALYMPGGGQFQTKKGIDYEAFTPAKVKFSSASPTTLSGPFEFALAK